MDAHETSEISEICKISFCIPGRLIQLLGMCINQKFTCNFQTVIFDPFLLSSVLGVNDRAK